MERKAIWRVWYGKSLGISQSFEDVGSADAAASFAAFIEADRIEVVLELLPWITERSDECQQQI
jgi:hypothetical protein